MWKISLDMIDSVKDCFHWLWSLWDLPEKCKECGKVKEV